MEEERLTAALFLSQIGQERLLDTEWNSFSGAMMVGVAQAFKTNPLKKLGVTR